MNKESLSPAGYPVTAWAKACGVSRATAFNLLRDRPDLIRSVRIGAKRIITTPPADFLAALAEEQSGNADAA